MASIPLDFPAAANQQQRSAAWLAALDALDLVCLRTAALDVVLEGVSDSTRQGVGLPQKRCPEVLTETGCRALLAGCRAACAHLGLHPVS